jgi:hypothetical protein
MWHEAVNRRFQDDADNLLVGPGVGHQEDSPEGYDAGDQETLLGMMIRVRHRAGQVAVEGLDGVREIDTVVGSIRAAPGLIPFEVDFNTAECVHKRST